MMTERNEEIIINIVNHRTLLALLLRRQGEHLQLKQSQLRYNLTAC